MDTKCSLSAVIRDVMVFGTFLPNMNSQKVAEQCSKIIPLNSCSILTFKSRQEPRRVSMDLLQKVHSRF
jgi:hypothetical protein